MKSLIDVVRGMLTRKFVKDQDVSTHVQTEEQPAQNVASQGFAPQGVVVCSSREQKEQFVNEMCETEGWAYYKQPSILQKEGHASLFLTLEEHLPDNITGKHLVCAFFLDGVDRFKHAGFVCSRLRHPYHGLVDTNLYHVYNTCVITLSTSFELLMEGVT